MEAVLEKWAFYVIGLQGRFIPFHYQPPEEMLEKGLFRTHRDLLKEMLPSCLIAILFGTETGGPNSTNLSTVVHDG